MAIDLAPGDDSGRDGQTLCKACGLCCRGVWFSHVRLGAEEVERAIGAGLPVETSDGQPSFKQPCVLHRDGCCSAYHRWRPQKCVDYTCSLLVRYLGGELDFEEALKHVTAARAMADRVQDEVGPLAGGLQGRVFMARLAESPGGEQTPYAPLSPGAKIDTAALRIYYSKYFMKHSPNSPEKAKP